MRRKEVTATTKPMQNVHMHTHTHTDEYTALKCVFFPLCIVQNSHKKLHIDCIFSLCRVNGFFAHIQFVRACVCVCVFSAEIANFCQCRFSLSYPLCYAIQRVQLIERRFKCRNFFLDKIISWTFFYVSDCKWTNYVCMCKWCMCDICACWYVCCLSYSFSFTNLHYIERTLMTVIGTFHV